MSAALVVAGAECRSAGAECGDKRRDIAGHGAEDGQARATKLDICRERDPRTASAKRAARVAYQRVLERALKRKFPELTLTQLSTSMDLEKSFGPVYARGMLKRGQSGFAVLGVNSQELQPLIDA